MKTSENKIVVRVCRVYEYETWDFPGSVNDKLKAAEEQAIEDFGNEMGYFEEFPKDFVSARAEMNY